MTSRHRADWLLCFVLAAVFSLAGCGSGLEERSPRSRLSVAELLGGEPETGYARAVGPKPIVFPEDHGPHTEFKTEWWYFTGNLSSAQPSASAHGEESSRRFGFQLTFFRNALSPDSVSGRASEWATRQLYMAHFAVTDVRAGRFSEHERLVRGALGLAGAQGEPFRVWVEDWEVRSVDRSFWPLKLRAQAKEVGLDLELRALKPIVLQGDRGYSRKGSDPSNASYYYSIPRMRASGTVRTVDGTFPVRGLVWLDREWSTSVLEEGQVGWDWFALQLSDGVDLMMYQLRRRDGSADPHSHAVLIGREGAKTIIEAEAFDIEPVSWWTSDRTDARYPIAWRLRAPSHDLDLQVRALVADQELDVSVTYWEGAVSAEGVVDSRQTAGYGYAELTGYADAPTRLDNGD